MFKILLSLFLIFSISSLFSQKDKRLKGIEKELNSILEATKAPGFSVAIVEGSKIIYAKGFGYSNYETKTLVDANTLFPIGSCTKSFTSSILGQLRQEDKINFEESPIKYVPELKFFNEEMNTNIVIKDLMSHRTGLPRHYYSWYLFPSNNKDSLLRRVTHQEPFTGVRKKWYYNNFMFLAQGVIAERITGKSWEENIKERFFSPIGMKRSNVSIDELEKSSNAAVGYKLSKDGVISRMDYYHNAGMSPAGSINSSVNDMSKWLITWINNGKFNGQQIIPEAFVNEAISSQMVIRGNLPDEKYPGIYLSNYGYAWFLSSYKGHYQVEHGGSIDGFTARISFFPSDSIGVIVLSNQNGSAVPGLVIKTIADRMLKTKKTDWVNIFSEQKLNTKKRTENTNNEVESTKSKNTKQLHIITEYEGKYSHPGYSQFSIKAQNDSLFAVFKLKTFYLSHVFYDVFKLSEVTQMGIDPRYVSPFLLNFVTNNVGEISAVNINIEETIDHPIEFKHLPKNIDVGNATLESYAGDYDWFGKTLKIYIKNENKLYLFLPGQQEFELTPTHKHKFSLKTLNGVTIKIEFVESEHKSIDKVVLIQPSGTFEAKRK